MDYVKFQEFDRMFSKRLANYGEEKETVQFENHIS